MESMTFKQAAKRYRKQSGTDFIEPDMSKCVHRGDAWLLSDGSGTMIALVTADEVLHGLSLKRWNFRERQAAAQIQEDMRH
jgi:hypothetical protein